CVPSAALLLVGLPVLAVIAAPLTIGPGLAGLGTYAGHLARGEGARWWRDSLGGTRARSAACAAVVALGLGATVLPVLTLRLMAAHGATVALTAILTAQTLVAAGVVVACVQAFGLLARYGQPAGMALRNAAVLAIRHPLSCAGPVVLGLIFLHVTLLLGWGPMVVLPAILALSAVHHTRQLVEDASAFVHEPSQETTCPLP